MAFDPMGGRGRVGHERTTRRHHHEEEEEEEEKGRIAATSRGVGEEKRATDGVAARLLLPLPLPLLRVMC